jgi:hypothetical protein
MATRLPIVKIKGKFYFWDNRLNEVRKINNPSERISLKRLTLSDLQKPTMKDRRRLEKLGWLA